MTPRLLFGLMRRWEDEQRRLDMRAGIIAAAVCNQWRGKRDKLAKAEDFVFSVSKPRRSGGRRQTTREHIAFIETYNVALGGTDLRGLDILPPWALGPASERPQ